MKGSDMSQARKDVQTLCRYLQDIINDFKREIEDLETKLLLVNFLESVKTVRTFVLISFLFKKFY